MMTAKKNGASPDKRRKYDEAFKAEIGSEGVARDPELRALLSHLKQAEQKLDI